MSSNKSNFENSAMKSSFSLSSLPVPESGEKATQKNREFNSLKKKRRESAKRLSWGSSSASEQKDKDEFWSGVVVSSYNFIMDNQLIDNCQDANCELSANSRTWTYDEFDAHFSEFYSWLNRMQEKIYGNEDNVTDRTLRAHCKSKIAKKRTFYNIFNEQGNQLLEIYTECREELLFRLNCVNTKWEELEPLLTSFESEQSDVIDIQTEVKALKNWLRTMESRLQPLSFQKKWSRSELEIKTAEHVVLHKDIENHGRIVNSIVKRTKDVAGLERRWHLLFLRSMEWQCYFENYIKRNSVLFSDSDSDEGPVKKHPRLSTGSPISSACLTCDTPKNNESDVPDGKYDDKIANETMTSQPETLEPKNVILGEDAQFDKSVLNAPNLGTYYFKHQDTDSDMDNVEQMQTFAPDADAQTNSETSGEEWTYTSNTTTKEHPKSPSSTHSIDKIRKIVQEVEEMVSPKRSNPNAEQPLNKAARIKQWLNNEKPDDSCDASSENEENESSESSEELNESIATYRAQGSLNASFTDLGFSASSPKVVMRQRVNSNRGMKGQRPYSIACITQLSKSNSRINRSTQSHSISESALHNLSLSTKMSASTSMTSHLNNSTSSTIEDSCAMLTEEQSSPARKKRFKSKKKTSVLRKDASTPYSSNASRDRDETLKKSGSFSGYGCIHPYCDRQTASDPSTLPSGHGFETTGTSGADTDEDKRFKNGLLVFKLGSDVRDNSPGKFSMGTNEEQSSSLCEEAWDSYQDKYSSEAYSEAHDSDGARRLLEFGEDYRTYLGSQSDWSAQSSSQLEFSPQFARKRFLPMNVIDSDSETGDLRRRFAESRNQLAYTESVFRQQQVLALNTFLINNDVEELSDICDRHISALVTLKPNEVQALPADDKREFSDLIASWQMLKGHITKMQEYRQLQSDIRQLKRHLSAIKMPATIEAFVLNTNEDLTRDIDFYSAELANIEDYKKKLLKVNVAVNHFTTENAEYNVSTLKTDVSELYRIWHEINNSATERLSRLNALQSWQMLENRLDQLRGDLRDDEQTLGVLDTALQGGKFSNQMASSVRGVAKLLSEAKTEGCSFPEIFTEGSFSDSGISDEGSEHDLGERERRLSAIRRVVRQLEVVMTPDCEARVRMRERLAAAEEELRQVQNKCRSIIVRTAVSATTPLSDTVEAAGPDGGDPGDEPHSGTPWFKRIVRASVSFQFAIMALLFVACLFEPHCCDNMNNIQLSMNPQLHYVRGPPPI